MLIASDLDNVLVDFQTPFMEFLNKRRGSNLAVNDVWTFRLDDLLGCAREEALALVFAFYESEPFRQLASLDDAASVVPTLTADNTLVALTSRPIDRTEVATRANIAEHFGNHIQEIHFSDHLRLPFERVKSKAEIAKTLGAQVLIDDHHEFLADCPEFGLVGLLYDAPWNRSVNLPGVKRVHSWAEIANQLTLITASA